MRARALVRFRNNLEVMSGFRVGGGWMCGFHDGGGFDG